MFTMLSSYRDSKKLTFGNKIKVNNYKSYVYIHRALRISTSVLFITPRNTVNFLDQMPQLL